MKVLVACLALVSIIAVALSTECRDENHAAVECTGALTCNDATLEIAVALSTECRDEHHAAAECMGALTCNDATMEVGCEHHQCTCVPKKIHCLDLPDCMNVTCPGHGHEQPSKGHCIDGFCGCL